MSDLNSTLVTRLKRILLYDLCTSTASTRIQEAIARIEELEAKLHHCETVMLRGEERDITEFDK